MALTPFDGALPTQDLIGLGFTSVEQDITDLQDAVIAIRNPGSPAARINWAMPDGMVGFVNAIDGVSPQNLQTVYYGGGSNNVWRTQGVAGACLTFPWCGIERSAGVFSFNELDVQVAFCAANNRKAILRPLSIHYAGTRSFVPDDLVATGQHSRDHGGFCPLYRNATVWSRWRKFVDALAAHYNSSATVVGMLLEETNWADFAADAAAFAAMGGSAGERVQAELMLAYAQAAMPYKMVWAGHGYQSGTPTVADYDAFIEFITSGSYCYGVNDLLPITGPAGYQSPPYDYGYLPYNRNKTLSLVDTASWANTFTAPNATLFDTFANSLKIHHLVWTVIGGAAVAPWTVIKPILANY